MNIKINENRLIGEDQPCYIIAEMSSNHGGDYNRAVEIIHVAKEAEADCIKIQTYTPDTLTINCNNEYFKIKNGIWKGEYLYNLYKKAYTPWDWQPKLKEEAERIGIDFLSTPFDKKAVDFLEELNVKFYKVASFELIDIPLIRYIASKKKPMIISTGMGTVEEIKETVNTVKRQNDDLCLLKCTSAYPADYEDINLITMQDMKKKFNVPVGLSDHSLGYTVAIAAVVLGAKVIEKHFCISRNIKTQDALFSMEPNEFKQMVREIRIAEKAVGKVNYFLSENEKKNRIFRRSIFAVKDIKKGDTFTENNIKIIRPGYGLKPKFYEDIIGKTAYKNIKRGTPIKWENIKWENDK